MNLSHPLPNFHYKLWFILFYSMICGFNLLFAQWEGVCCVNLYAERPKQYLAGRDIAWGVGLVCHHTLFYGVLPVAKSCIVSWH